MRNAAKIFYLAGIFPVFLLTQQAMAQCSNGGIPSNVELVTNGDFSAGNSGFNSSYTFCNTANCLFPETYYAVDVNPTFYHPNFTGVDHTTGSGNFMIVNGSSIANVDVWCQTISVVPGTDYLFSTWVNTLNTTNPAKLQFSINGVNIGTIFSAPLWTGTWSQFFETWNSGANTSATICIVNQNTVTNGNDFGLDDISFQPCTCAAYAGGDTAMCEGQLTSLSGSGGGSYQWTPAAGLSDPTIANPVASPSATTTYTLTVTTGTGVCTASDSVTVTVNQMPVINCGPDTTIKIGNTVQLGANGGGGTASYAWTPPAGLSCTDCPNPKASPSSTTTYKCVVSDQNGCPGIDSITVFVVEETLFIPNAFTPNEDNKNAVFTGYGLEIKDFDMTIYNKWGQAIFHTTDIQKGWDGKSKGQYVQEDVYLYYIKCTWNSGADDIRIGRVTVIR